MYAPIPEEEADEDDAVVEQGRVLSSCRRVGVDKVVDDNRGGRSTYQRAKLGKAGKSPIAHGASGGRLRDDGALVGERIAKAES